MGFELSSSVFCQVLDKFKTLSCSSSVIFFSSSSSSEAKMSEFAVLLSFRSS